MYVAYLLSVSIYVTSKFPDDVILLFYYVITLQSSLYHGLLFVGFVEGWKEIAKYDRIIAS